MEIPKTTFVVTFGDKDLSADATRSESFSFSYPIVNPVAGTIELNKKEKGHLAHKQWIFFSINQHSQKKRLALLL